MAKKTKKDGKYFTSKSYIYMGLGILAVILLIAYCVDWYIVKRKDKLMNSYLITSNTLTYEIKDLSEIEQILKEAPSEYFVLISYNNDDDVYRLEKKLKKVIDEYELNEKIYYVNVTDQLEEDSLYSELNETFNTSGIVNIPCILYYKDNLLEKIIVKENGLFQAKDLTNLLEEYDYQK